MKEPKTQTVSLRLEKTMIEHLKERAREIAFKNHADINYNDLIVTAINEKYEKGVYEETSYGIETVFPNVECCMKHAIKEVAKKVLGSGNSANEDLIGEFVATQIIFDLQSNTYVVKVKDIEAPLP